MRTICILGAVGILAGSACGEPAQSSVVQVEILPEHLQSFPFRPDQISVSLIGKFGETRPVLDVLSSAEFLDLTNSTRGALTPIATPQDVTYRGAHTQWFAFPAARDGEYEIAVQFADWGANLVSTSSLVDEMGAWRSRFHIDANWFYLNGLSVCDDNHVLIQFSEPFASFPVSEFPMRVNVITNQTVVSCTAEADNGVIGGFELKLQCASAILSPFKVTFSGLLSATGAKPLSARKPPHESLGEVLIDGAALVETGNCVGWGTP